MFESQFISTYPTLLIASDEAGRGPLAGPVAAASVAVVLESALSLSSLVKTLHEWGVDDSKKMKESKRSIIAHKDLSLLGLRSGVSLVSAQEIDEINILQASLRAMRLSALECVSDHKNIPVVWLVDGNKKPEGDKEWMVHPIVKGDSKSLLIGLASVLAKVKRDELMQTLHHQYPQYGFNQHAGYPTATHRQSI
ncbi:MAG: ribonuclease HII, partial [Proteobacteria bacterium]|nr:ribonuclease HII [Pseudomonadota bacterium]